MRTKVLIQDTLKRLVGVGLFQNSPHGTQLAPERLFKDLTAMHAIKFDHLFGVELRRALLPLKG